jgi:hypothetical protein
MTVEDIQKRLKDLGSRKHAAVSQRFFKKTMLFEGQDLNLAICSLVIFSSFS